MENLTHTLVGAALAEAGLKRATPLATPTLIIAANIPDIDILYAFFGRYAYLEGHRGITHSLLGFPLLALLFAAAVYAYSRFVREPSDSKSGPKNGPKSERARFIPLAALSLIAVATHPLLDYTNAYGWRPFLPFDSSWSYIDVAFVADPWIWIGLGGALFLARAQTPKDKVGWLALFALLSLVLVLVWAGKGIQARVGTTAIVIWFALLALVLVLKARLEMNERRARRLGLGALCGLLLYLTTLAVLQAVAIYRIAEAAHVAIAPSEQVVGVDALPTEIDPLRWRAVVSTEEAFYLGDIHLGGGSELRFERHERERGDIDLIERARDADDARIFLRFARFPVARVHQAASGAVVEFEDLRFAGPRNSFRIRIPVQR